MLVLSRRPEESLIITTPDGVRIEVIVTKISGGKAWIGIDAPTNFAVHRGEVQARIDAEQEQP